MPVSYQRNVGFVPTGPIRSAFSAIREVARVPRDLVSAEYHRVLLEGWFIASNLVQGLDPDRMPSRLELDEILDVVDTLR
jgi:hypothetical protein